MGIVLKRRDNAPIVKHVFGNVIEKIMIDKDFNATLDWLKESLSQIRNGEFSMRYFVITKSLRGYYKNPPIIIYNSTLENIFSVSFASISKSKTCFTGFIILFDI